MATNDSMKRKQRSSEIEELFNLSRDMLCIAGTDGLFKCVNPAFERILGWTEDELLSRPFFDFIHPDDVEATQLEVGKLAQGIPTISFENRYRCSNGEYKVLRWTAQPDPERGLLFSVARDVTKRRRQKLELLAAKERAEEADRAKSDFLANISHEIRTPMNGIIGMTELALTSATDSRAREYLHTIQQSADSLLELIGDILDLSKIESGKIELAATDFNLRDVVGDALKSIAVEGHRKGLEIVCTVSAKLPGWLIGDAVRLRQILVNLVGNAIKFTHRGEILVEVEPEPADGEQVRVRFAVRDTGVGIAEDKLDEIFESFTQADRSSSRRYGGTGLGLAISSRLVELMDGKLRVESTLGEGSVFHFTARMERSSSSRGSGIGHIPPDLAGLRAVVVDDNRSQRRVLAEILARWRIVATCVEAAADALSEIKSLAERDETLDLLLVDREMPGVGGLSLIAELRKEGLVPAGVILLLTQASRPDDFDRARDLGISVHLSKPFKEVELLDAVSRAAGLSEDPVSPVVQHSDLDPARGKILVVEDDSLNQEIAAGLLQSRGYEVEVVDNGKAAVARVEQASYSLVLMDVQMPGMDGFEATAAIRALEATNAEMGRTRVLAMTALTGPDDRNRCFEAGMDGYLAKPLRARELFAAIDDRASAHPAGIGAPARAPASAALPSSTAFFDCERALEAVNGDEALLRRIAGAAVLEVPRLVQALAEASAACDAAALEQASHQLKGSICMFSSDRLRRSLESLHAVAQRREMERCRELVQKVKQQVEETMLGVRLLPDFENAGLSDQRAADGGGASL